MDCRIRFLRRGDPSPPCAFLLSLGSCAACGAPLSLSDFRFECAECKAPPSAANAAGGGAGVGLLFCLRCFCGGAETGQHRNDHDYFVAGPNATELFAACKPLSLSLAINKSMHTHNTHLYTQSQSAERRVAFVAFSVGVQTGRQTKK